MQYNAHSNDPLKEHLKAVGVKSKEIIKKISFNDRIDVELLSNISYLIGISHDFGKFTIFFQEKLELGINQNGKSHHGLISAFFCYELIKEYLKSEEKENHETYKYLPLIGYLVVKRHHGNLESVSDSVNPYKLYDEFRNIHYQVEDILNHKSEIETIYQNLLSTFNLNFIDIFNNFLKKYQIPISYENQIEDVINPLVDLTEYFEHNHSILLFLLTQLLFSVLIDSDKKHAGKVSLIERKDIPIDIVDKYKQRDEFKEKNQSNINQIRDEIYKSVMRKIEKHKGNKIFSITVPTGTGKTLTSLSAALRLRKIVKQETNENQTPRIIYLLPFTSIIDQNFCVFEDVLEKTIPDFKGSESIYLLKHHHLAEIKYKLEGEDKPIDESLALIETWESEIIVTTFIQFFYSVIGYKNRFLKKFHNIAGSIIILDEVQNIPIKYWNLVGMVLEGLAEYFDCRVILLTATQPLIFKEGKYIELVEDNEKYFKKDELNRVSLIIDKDDKNINEFFYELKDWSKDSYMFVFNTIGSTLKFCDLLQDQKKKCDMEEFEIVYLSTNIVPKERKERIEKIQNFIDTKSKVIIVTTQLIEAGVDIDVEVVYRDIGPLDSIIQVAGRCNRKKMLVTGEVHVVKLKNEDDNDQLFSRYIYSPVLLNIVNSSIFKEKEHIRESEFLGLIKEYFKQAKPKMMEEKQIIKSIYELYYYDNDKNYDSNKKPISAFELIEKEQPKIDVFIELDEEAKFIWKKYSEIRKLQPIERKEEFLKIKKKFYDYVISVQKKYTKKVGYNDNIGIGHISLEEIDSYYNINTGFMREDAGSGSLFG